MRRKKIITIPNGTADKIARYHGCSRVTVFNALAYKSDSLLANSIRRDALSMFGGVETSKVIF